jgi:protein-S-isoprenylcysteine O-methyltransferase Ste14
MDIISFLVILTLGILAIRILWIVTEPGSVRTQLTGKFARTNLIELIILALQFFSALYFPWPLNPFTQSLMVAGTGMYLFGMFLAIWARFTMQNNWGHPGQHNIKKQEALVTAGPFRISRNPIYVGFLCIYFGYALAVRSWLIVLRIPLAIYFYRSVLSEEKVLEKYFGKTYKAYKASVPRFLII